MQYAVFYDIKGGILENGLFLYAWMCMFLSAHKEAFEV